MRSPFAAAPGDGALAKHQLGLWRSISCITGPTATKLACADQSALDALQTVCEEIPKSGFLSGKPRLGKESSVTASLPCALAAGRAGTLLRHLGSAWPRARYAAGWLQMSDSPPAPFPEPSTNRNSYFSPWRSVADTPNPLSCASPLVPHAAGTVRRRGRRGAPAPRAGGRRAVLA